MNKENNKELKKLFTKFGWTNTDLNDFVKKAEDKSVIEKSD